MSLPALSDHHIIAKSIFLFPNIPNNFVTYCWRTPQTITSLMKKYLETRFFNYQNWSRHLEIDAFIIFGKSKFSTCSVQKQSPEVLHKKGFPKMFEKLCNVIKKTLQHRCFTVNIGKFLRSPISKNSC